MERHHVASPGTGRFDAFRLSSEGACLEGALDAVSLPRINERLVEDRAPVQWRIRGTRDALGHPAMVIEVDGVLPLECQRCLGAYRWPVHQRTELLLAHTEAEMSALDNQSELEVVLAAGPLDPVELVEDELVLAVPFAPRHPEGECPPSH